MCCERILVRLLFEWGAFNNYDSAVTAPLVGMYAACIPLYSCAGFCSRALHAQQEMKHPACITGASLLVNLIGGLIFMQFFGVLGLVFANFLAAGTQAALLLRGVIVRAVHRLDATVATAVACPCSGFNYGSGMFWGTAFIGYA